MVEISRLDYLIANNMKSDFIGSISHEFRSPLHGILASAEFLRDSKLDIPQEELVSTIQTCGSTLLDTIDHVLDYSQINSFEKKTSAGLLSNELDQTANVALLCEDIVDGIIAARGFGGNDDFDPRFGKDSKWQHESMRLLPASDSRVEIVLDFQNRDWDFQFQPGALRRIVMNLFINAQKYTETGYIIVKLRVREADAHPPDGTFTKGLKTLGLNIIDSGRGMSKQFMERRLYLPFAQEDSFAPGTGLGLSIVRSIVTQLGGKINISSELGRGTDVEVLLPLKEPGSRSKRNAVNTNYGVVDSNIDAAKAIKIVQEIAHGKSLIIWRNADGETDRNNNSLLWNTVAEYCTSWFGFKILPGHLTDLSSQADFIIKERLDDASNVSNTPPTDQKSRILFLQKHHSRARHAYSSTPFSGMISMPVGPFKLARSILTLLHHPSHLSDVEKEHEIFPSRVPIPNNESIAGYSDAPRTDNRISPDGIPTHIRDGHSPSSLDLAMRPNSLMSEHPPTRPAKQDLPHQALHPVLPPSSHTGSMRPLRILAVDDNALNLLLLTRYLGKRLQDSIVTAMNGVEAVKVVKESETCFDVVFMDISMPLMDGFEATRAIREFEQQGIGDNERWPYVRPVREGAGQQVQKIEKAYIVALTGLASRRDRDEAVRSGFDHFLTKPVNFKVVGQIIEQLSQESGKVVVE